VTVSTEGTTMPKWVCGKCKTVVEGRCRPAACPKCKAPKEQFKKKA
jgi:rubrerythrin